jgi:hypothetical protein
MSPVFDWISLLAGTAFCLYFRFLDYRITTVEFPKWGVKEENPFLRTKSGGLSQFKVWLVCPL